MNNRPVGLAAAFTMAVIGCVPSTPGELGAGSFTYECEQEGYDPACADSFSNQHTVPAKVAVEAPFEVTFYATSGSDEPGTASVVAASGEMISGSNARFTFVKPGFGAILARESSGTIIDFLHIQALPVDHLGLRAGGKDVSDTLQMDVGDSLLVTAEPEDAQGAILSGALEYTWSATEDIVSLDVQDYSPNQVELVANAEGTVQVTVSAAGRAQTIQLVIGGQP